MLRPVLFQLHWLIGISFGLIIAVVGFTGGLLSYESEIIKLLSPGIMDVEVPSAQKALSPEALLASLQKNSGKRVSSFNLSSNPEDSVAVRFVGAGRGEVQYANPYTGEFLGAANGRQMMSSIRALHRWLLLDIKIGRPIVGIATILLIVLAISGIYLRWPKNAFNLRQWLAMNWRQKGHSFWWHLHAVFGTWALIFYLVASLTGLWWSFDWYRAGVFQMAGVEQPTRFGPPRNNSSTQAGFDSSNIALNTVWQNFLKQSQGNYQDASINLPQNAKDGVSIRYLPKDAAHERASNTLVFNAQTAAFEKGQYYQDKSTGEKFIASIFPLHAGSFFGFWGILLMMLASLAMPIFAISGWILYLKRKANQRTSRAIQKHVDVGNKEAADYLIAYASQSGRAEAIAWQTAQHLQQAGNKTYISHLNKLSPSDFKTYQKVLLITSTFGDGQAPDNGKIFSKKLNQTADLHGVNFALLALGDSSYEHFCEFGKNLAARLEAHNASALFAPIFMDLHDSNALALWQQQVNQLAGSDATWQSQDNSSTWTLIGRQCLNPNSTGAPVWHIQLKAQQTNITWQAGDLISIAILQDGVEQLRDYSIASVNSYGIIELLIREARHDDGKLGLGSAFFLQQTKLHDSLRLTIRSNSHFHNKDNKAAIYIGNGTGLAGLMSHLQERQQNKQSPNWLIFGERKLQNDFYFEDQIQSFVNQGHLSQLSLAFSQDQEEKVYVQDLLQENQEQLRQWLAQGATLYICGSAETMAKDVDNTLSQLLGDAVLQSLIEQGRYRRDVY